MCFKDNTTQVLFLIYLQYFHMLGVNKIFSASGRRSHFLHKLQVFLIKIREKFLFNFQQTNHS